jgi:hypothetical protein
MKIHGLRVGLGIALLATVAGCVGYVDGGGYYDGGGATVVVDTPGVWWGGGVERERGRDVHEYSHRGSESRGVAHGGGGRKH